MKFKKFTASAATCAVSPESSYLFLKDAIGESKKSLLLYIYDVSAPYLIDLLAAAKKRKVKIRAMYDANFGGTAELAALKKVASARNVKAAPSKGDRSVFTVCHQKFVVIDGQTVVVESANWAKSSVPEIKTSGKFKKANREWFIRFDDANIAQWFTDLFNADFGIKPVAVRAAAVEANIEFEDVIMAALVKPPAKLFPSQQVSDPEAVVTPIVSPDNYLKEVKALLKAAEKSICLQQQYILAGKGIKDLLEIIAQKAGQVPESRIADYHQRHVRQELGGDQENVEATNMLDSLRALNPGPFTHCHNKGVIVDDQAVVVSSTNWSENSVLRAREAGVLVRSKKIAAYYRDVFDLDWKEGLKPEDIDAASAVVSAADAL